MQRAIAIWTQCLVVAALAAWPPPSAGAPFHADTSASQLVIRTTKRGLLSALSHDHQFTPGRWRADVEFDPARPRDIHVDVRIDAATLHDTVPRLTQSMRDHVDLKTAGPEVLDAQRYPEIRFDGTSASARPEGADLGGVLHGELSLHGTTRALDVPFRAHAEPSGHRVSGTVRFRQTDYGMTPYSAARGSIGVDDEIEVDFELVLVPAAPSAGGATRVGAR